MAVLTLVLITQFVFNVIALAVIKDGIDKIKRDIRR